MVFFVLLVLCSTSLLNLFRSWLFNFKLIVLEACNMLWSTTKWINCLDSDNPVKAKKPKWSGVKPSHLLGTILFHLKVGGKKPTGRKEKKREVMMLQERFTVSWMMWRRLVKAVVEIISSNKRNKENTLEPWFKSPGSVVWCNGVFSCKESLMCLFFSLQSPTVRSLACTVASPASTKAKMALLGRYSY